MEQQAVVGAVLSILINILKWVYQQVTHREMSGTLAVWMTMLLCLVSGTGLLWMNGELAIPTGDVPTILRWMGESYLSILGVATTFYNIVLSKRGIRGL